MGAFTFILAPVALVELAASDGQGPSCGLSAEESVAELHYGEASGELASSFAHAGKSSQLFFTTNPAN